MKAGGEGDERGWDGWMASQTTQYQSNPVYVLASNAEKAEVEQFYEDQQDLLELTPIKDVFSL